MSIEQNYEKRLNQILINDDFKEISILNRGFVITKQIATQSLLFIGINPSYKERKSEQPKSITLFDDNRNTSYNYFKKFEIIVNDLKLKYNIDITWHHLDLLFYRNTSQKYFDQLVKEKNGKKFIIEQLEISKEIIETSQPKIIVINNTLARELIQDKIDLDFKFNYKIEFDKKIGTHRLSENGTPIFFTSMLTGQRALDLGSFERLTWHIKFVLDKL